MEDRWIPELGAKVRCESCDRLLWIPAPSSENGDMDLLYDLPETTARRISFPQPEESPREPAPVSATDQIPAAARKLEDTEEGPVGPDPLEILDEKLRTWIAGRDDPIRRAIGAGSFFATFGEEFLEMVEGDPELTRIEAAVKERADSSGVKEDDGSTETPGWLALSRLRRLLLEDSRKD